MGTTKAYDDLVEGFRAKISGNISSVKMTPEETAKEIAEVTEGVFAEREEGNKGEIKIPCAPIVDFPPELFGKAKKKRGRPLGSKNKPKDAKA